MKLFLSYLLVGICLIACTSVGNTDQITDDVFSLEGDWVFTMDLGDVELPFNVSFFDENGRYSMIVRNADEEIRIEDISLRRDSIFIQMPFFNSRFVGKLNQDGSILGAWYDDTRSNDYHLPFTAKKGQQRFEVKSESTDIAEKWKMVFSPESEKPCLGIGQFTQDGNLLTGTIITETGDYRFLQGVVDGNTLKLSCFDGSHAFLFIGEKQENGEIHGQFWSGNHHVEPFVGTIDPTYQLADPDSLTYIAEDKSVYDLSFVDKEGVLISLGSEQFKNKVLIVQIMGTWCPNCLDECRSYKTFYDKYHEAGLEVVAVAYERGEDTALVFERIDRFCNQIGISYPMLYGGKASKPLASSHFDMLNQVISFPTSIILDRNGVVRRVHTGFYGPGTGEHYERYMKDMDTFLSSLIEEGSVNS